MTHPRILQAIQSELWAITPDKLESIIAIAQGYGDAEAVAAKLGRPLNNTRTVSVRDNVAVIPVNGPIFRYANLFTEISGATSIQTLATDFQTSVDDPSITAIILEMDTPGGQVAGVSEFAAQVRAATAIKPVIAYASDLTASAGYWIASAASQIIAADTAWLGSIGVVIRAYMSKDSNEIKIISSQSPDKQVDIGSDKGKLQFQKRADQLADVFINAVANYRDVSRESVIANFGQGGVLLAADAVSVGMADAIGSLESLIAEYSAYSNQRGYSVMSKANTAALTKEQIAADYPDIAKAFVDEGHQAGFKEGMAQGMAQGAEQERNRIKAVEAQSLPGHEALINQLKFDGSTTGEQAAVQVLAAEKTMLNTKKDSIDSGSPKPVAHTDAQIDAQKTDAKEENLSSLHRQLFNQVAGGK